MRMKIASAFTFTLYWSLSLLFSFSVSPALSQNITSTCQSICEDTVRSDKHILVSLSFFFSPRRVKELSDDNRMHIQNLAIVFGPTLMWHETEKVSKTTSSNHSSVSSNNNSNSCTNNSPSSPSSITVSSTGSTMTPFTYGNLMNGINGSFANDMLQKIKSNQLVEFLLMEFDSLFTR